MHTPVRNKTEGESGGERGRAQAEGVRKQRGSEAEPRRETERKTNGERDRQTDRAGGEKRNRRGSWGGGKGEGARASFRGDGNVWD